jgi:hypothetical protein
MADMSTDDLVNQLLTQTTVAPTPSVLGVSAPPDPNQLQALLGKLKQQQYQQQQSQPTPGEYGFLHDAGKQQFAQAGQMLGNLLQRPGGLGGTPPAAPQTAPFSLQAAASSQDGSPPSAPIPVPSQGATPQQSVSNAVQAAKFYHASLIKQGVPADQAQVQTLSKMEEWGVPGASDKLAAAQEQLLKNSKEKAEAFKDTSQGNASADEISNRAFDQRSKTFSTTFKDPAGFYEIQTNGTGEDRRVELKNPPSASAQAVANLSPQGLDYMVQTYKQTGQVPVGLARSPAVAGRFWDAVAKDPEVSADPNSPRAIIANKLANQSNGQALAQTQKQLSATTAYVGTMDKNISKARELAAQLDFSDPTLVNKALMAWNKGTSDPTTAKYNVFFDAIANEYAKIKSGSLGNTAVSDSARTEARTVLTPLISQVGVNAAFDAVQQEAKNRTDSLSQERDRLIGVLQGKAPITAPATPKPATDDSGGGGWQVVNGVKIRLKQGQ